MAYIRSFKTQTTLSEYIAGPFTITQIPQNIDVETITVSTAVKLYRGLIYEKITTSVDDPGTIAKLLVVINELEEGSGSAGGFGGLFKIINLGTANGIHKETVNGEAKLKSIRAGSNIVVSANDDEITITGTTPPVSVPIDSIDNVGPLSAAGIYKDISGQTARLRRISAGDNVTIVQNADDITINAVIPPIPSQGVVSGQNVGNNTGYGVFKDVLNTTTARFKRIIPGNNITMSSTDDDITINAVVPVITPATVTNLANTGSVSSVGVFKELTSTVGYFRKLKAGNNATVALDGDDITISAIIPSPSGAQTITNVGTSGAADVFKQLAGTEAQLRRIKEGSNISIDVVGDDIVISAVPGEGAEFASGVNVGAGEGAVYKNTLGSNLVFRTIKAGDNISIVQNADELVINAIEGGETDVAGVVSDATAGAESVINNTQDNIVHLKGVKAGANATVTTVGNDIVIAANPGVTTGSNVGTGEGQVFKQINSGTASFKSIKAGDNIVITDDGDTITIDAETGGDVGLTTLASDGTSGSVAVTNGVTGSTAHFKGIKGGANVSVTEDLTDITIAATFDGMTSGQNDGDGVGKIFKSVTGGVGSYRSIKAGTGVSISQDADNVIINAAGGSSGVVNVVNNGSGEGAVGIDVTGPDLNLRTIKAGSNITITETAEEIVIGSNMDLTGAVTALQNVDGGDSYDARVFKNTTAGVASMRSIKAGTNVSIVEGPDVITINASGGSSTSLVNDGDGVGKVYKSTVGADVHLRSIKAGSGVSIAQDTNNIVISATGGGGGGSGTATGFNDYSDTNAYTAGEVATKDGLILRAKEPIDAGAFDATKWEILGDGAGRAENTIDRKVAISASKTPYFGFSDDINDSSFMSNSNSVVINSGDFIYTQLNKLTYNNGVYFELDVSEITGIGDQWFEMAIAKADTPDLDYFVKGIDTNGRIYFAEGGNCKIADAPEFAFNIRFGYSGGIDFGQAKVRVGAHNTILGNNTYHLQLSNVLLVNYNKIAVIITKGDRSINIQNNLNEHNGLSIQVHGYNNNDDSLTLLAKTLIMTPPYFDDSMMDRIIISSHGFNTTINNSGTWLIPDSAFMNLGNYNGYIFNQDVTDDDRNIYCEYGALPAEPWSIWDENPPSYPALAGPANDNFADAALITVGENTGYSTVLATSEAGEPDPVCDNGPQNTIWFKWVAPTTGRYRVDTGGSLDYQSNDTADTILTVYAHDGSNNIANLTFVDGADGGYSGIDTENDYVLSKVVFETISGQEYRFQVNGYNNGDCLININIMETTEDLYGMAQEE